METDNNLILSHCCWIRLLVTSMNVIHSWGIYSLGWKFDGIPGILNGIYYHLCFIGFFNGLCYELCGLLHNFMSIRVVCYILVIFYIIVELCKKRAGSAISWNNFNEMNWWNEINDSEAAGPIHSLIYFPFRSLLQSFHSITLTPQFHWKQLIEWNENMECNEINVASEVEWSEMMSGEAAELHKYVVNWI